MNESHNKTGEENNQNITRQQYQHRRDTIKMFKMIFYVYRIRSIFYSILCVLRLLARIH